MTVRAYRAIPRTTETEPETKPEAAIPRTAETELETEPEAETDTELSIYLNIRDFGLSTRMRSFVRVIFSIFLSVYFLDVWRFLYFPTI